MLVLAHHEIVGAAGPVLLATSGLTVAALWRLSTSDLGRRLAGWRARRRMRSR